MLFKWLRELDSNQRPSGYEPDELPLLHPAIFSSLSWVRVYYNTKFNVCQAFYEKNLQKVKIPSETASDIMSVRNNICRCAVNIRAFFKFLPEISFLTGLLYTLSVIIKSKDKTRCKSVRLIQKEENMSFIVLFIGLIIYGIWKNCEPQIPASYHNNWKLEQEDSWKASTGEMSKRQFMKNIQNGKYR